uniref:Pentatricopeptide repeat-containing protein n=1 Tax=Ananas comosus var. bracteatus TaxID=296719 RepID=A0A6V7PZK9_ANACO|nr:unnamed protein product [Ananas comosus var. bracteatus]
MAIPLPLLRRSKSKLLVLLLPPPPVLSFSHSFSNISSSPDPAAIFALISRHRWSRLQTLTGAATAAAADDLLRRLLSLPDSDPLLLLRLSRWSRRRFLRPTPLHLHSRLLLLLADRKLYPRLRSELHLLAASRAHSPSSLLHSLSSSLLRHDRLALLADMLVLALVRTSQTSSAFEAFRCSADYGCRLSVLSVNPLLSALIDEGEIDGAETVYKEMMRRKIGPNLITFNTAINGLCKSGKLRRAEDLIKDMRTWGLCRLLSLTIP